MQLLSLSSVHLTLTLALVLTITLFTSTLAAGSPSHDDIEHPHHASPTKCKPCAPPCTIVNPGASAYCNCIPKIVPDGGGGNGTIGVGRATVRVGYAKRDRGGVKEDWKEDGGEGEGKKGTGTMETRPAKCLETVY